MKKDSTSASILVVVIIFVLVGLSIPYNNLVHLRNQVNEQTAQIENVLQGRLEKIPDLVENAKALMAHEDSIFPAIAEARTGLQSAIESGDVDLMAEANESLTQVLTSLRAVVEAYPEINSAELLRGLADEIAGSVNRIQQERRTYNQVVTEYNNALEVFPTVLYARLLGFKPAKYFQATEEAHQINVVNYGD